MRNRTRWGTIESVDRGTRCLTIELQGAEDPLVGQLTDEHGNTVEFRGWLGLASGLEQLLGPGRVPPRNGPARQAGRHGSEH
jgi:hypothetical protein